MPEAAPNQSHTKKFENKLNNPKTKVKRRGWAAKRRTLQRRNILKTKPWLKATGPRTRQGKDKSRQNAYRTGAYTAEMQCLRQVLKKQRDWLKAYLQKQCCNATTKALVRRVPPRHVLPDKKRGL
ncbi:MAG: hypothetical protein EBQ96_06615 [Proteobacteria bacterium]|nr:hypothetical protein [Pseudomonadota bacterium]